jgi:phospholipase C
MQTTPNRRWAIWISDPKQHSTDTLAKWEAKAKAKVDWVGTEYRLSKNEVVHEVVPYRESTLPLKMYTH